MEMDEEEPLAYALFEKGETAAEVELTTTEIKIKGEGERTMASYSVGWEALWGDTLGKFEYTTSLAPMLFGPRPYATVASTLQIYSIKVHPSPAHDLPLKVYGLVAARDSVDHNRNFLFHRRRNNCQILTPKDPCLELTGPSRAIVFGDPVRHVQFEVQLKVKGKTESQDRILISQVCPYYGTSDDYGHPLLISNESCRIELRFEKLDRTVQATILGVQVVEGPWPFIGETRVVARTECSADEVELTCFHGTVPIASENHDLYLDLSRQVVSVELEKMLLVEVRACTSQGDKIGLVSFTPKKFGISKGSCWIDRSKVVITVAWSLLVTDIRDVLLDGLV